MILNTEWGTAAILAYSNFGQVPTSELDTITGNASGIFNMYGGKSEFTTGFWKGSGLELENDKIYNSNQRYYNLYESKISQNGDAMGSIFGISTGWPNGTRYLVGRGSSSIIKAFGAKQNNGTYTSRAAVVCGEGL